MDMSLNFFDDDVANSIRLQVQIKKKGECASLFCRVGAILAGVWCIFILISESLLIASTHGSDTYFLFQMYAQDFWLIFFTTVIITSGICISSFFTIFKIKISDTLQITKKHTDCVTFCSFISLFSKITQVVCFNFMVLSGEVQRHVVEGKDAPFQTSFIKFYSSMIETPFLGTKYNYILPGSMLVFCIIFIVLNLCKMENKAVKMLRKVNKQPQVGPRHQMNENLHPLFD